MADITAEDEREEELSSITAIFPELAIDPSNPFAASLDITVAPSSPLAVVFPSAVDGAPPRSLPTPPTSDTEAGKLQNGGAASAPRDIHQLSYLPPLRLQITLPDGYPSEKPPHFELSTSPKWLPDAVLQRLKNDGLELWEEYGRMQVVFAYIDLLQQGAEHCFELVGNEGAVLEVPAEMKIELLDYDIKAKRAKFEHETFDCGVCLEPKKGSVCYRMSRCGDVFCVACLQDFYNNCIQEGDVASVKCLAPDCGKDTDGQNAPGNRRKKKSGRTLNPSELLQIPIEKSMVQRYVELKRKKKLESDKSTVYCPRKWCQGPARSKKYPKITDLSQIVDSESESEDEASSEPRDRVEEQMRGSSSDNRLAVCENCEYAFCRVCLAGWHGDYIRCYPRSAAELSAEEQASYDYLRLHTSPCPTCSSPTQKTHGCNHMSCFQCRTHFCYLCGAWLDSSNPYEHFNKKDTSCYMRLWELEEGDEGEGNVRFDGPRGWEAAIAAADEADAREAQAAENAAAAAPANPARVPPHNLPAAPMPPRAAVDPPLIVAMNNMILAPGAQRQGHAQAQQQAAPAPRQNQQQQQQQQQQQPQQNAGRAAAPRRPAGGPGANVVGGAARNRDGREGAEQGLQRFLQLVQNDEEDGWDSDELDGEDEGWAIPER